MRLSELLYSQGFGTRRLCAGLIENGLVTVRGEVLSGPERRRRWSTEEKRKRCLVPTFP